MVTTHLRPYRKTGMGRNMKKRSKKAPARGRRRAHARPLPPPPKRGGRKRSEASTPFARWLDAQDLDKVADAVGISKSSLYQIRRGDQGVSMATVRKLVDYARGELTADSFLPAA